MGSTTWKPPAGKIKPARPGQKRSAGAAGSTSRTREGPQRSVIVPAGHRSPVTVTLTFMPGSDPWVRVARDGHTTRIPARLQVWEFVLWLNGWS